MKRIGSRVVSWVVAVAVTAMLSPVSMSFAAVLSDEVTSVKLKEADGTSGQNTNSGSGVKTGHIQDGAVTASKIINGAVTDAKITGPISASKIQAGVFQQKNVNVVIVAMSGGDFTDPAAAVDSIANASDANPYLVKIMPGVYTGPSITMKQFVSLEGSGQDVTKLANMGITCANNSEIRNFSLVEGGISANNVTTKISGISILATNATYPIMSTDSITVIDNVKILLNTDSGASTWAILADVSGSNQSELYVKNSEIIVNAELSPMGSYVGIANTGSAYVDIDSTKITVKSGANVASGAFRVNSIANSKILVTSSQPYSSAIQPTNLTKIYNTFVEAPTFVYGAGVLKCANVYDTNLQSICPTP